MKHFKKAIVMAVAGLVVAGFLCPPQVFSITVAEEEEMSHKMMGMIYQYFDIIDDPEIVGYVNKVGQRLLAAMPQQPFQYHFHVIRQEVYNAFATPAGHVFVYSGLIEAMDEEEELAGILGHEIAHVYCRHISQKIERSKKIGIATLAGMAAGILVGAGGGSPEAAAAITQGSAAAGQSVELSFSRSDETQADQFGLKFITQAGYSASGLLKILKKIRSKTWFGTNEIPTYLMTHPAVENRIAYIQSWLTSYNSSHKSIPLVNQDYFKRIHTQVETRYGNEETVFSKLKDEVARNPKDPMAHYRYGLILAREGRWQEAIEQLRITLTKKAFDPYVLKDLGRIYFLGGQYQKALKTLENVRAMIPDDPECLFYLGRTQLELEHYQQASVLLTKVTQKFPGFSAAYYFLGQSLGKLGSLGDAHYYLGIFYLKKRDLKTARVQLEQALKHSLNGDKRQEAEKLLAKISGKKPKDDGG